MLRWRAANLNILISLSPLRGPAYGVSCLCFFPSLHYYIELAKEPRTGMEPERVMALQPQRTGPDAGLVVCHILKTLANRLEITPRWFMLVGSGTLRCPSGRLLRRLLAEEPGTNQEKTRDRANSSHTRSASEARWPFGLRPNRRSSLRPV
jgi:hypothetical protein